MAIATTNERPLYPFARIFQVATSSTDAVDIWQIPVGTIITRVLAQINVAGTGSGNLTVGDDDSGNGYILAADATAAAGTVYGDLNGELGTYLAGTAAGAGCAPCWKEYHATGKELKMDCSGALTTEATVDVMVFGYSFKYLG